MPSTAIQGNFFADTRIEMAPSAQTCRIAGQPIVSSCRSARDDQSWLEVLIRPAGPFLNMAPQDFVVLSYEQRGLLLDEEMVSRTLLWLARQPSDARVSINVHPASLASISFLDSILAGIAWSGLNPRQVCLELVEFTEPVSLSRTQAGLERLRRSGIGIALDDFGVGQPNFELCAAGLVDYIKVDRKFTASVESSARHRKLFSGICKLSREMDIEVVAEGVETRSQLECLVDLGADWLQGHFLQRPFFLTH